MQLDEWAIHMDRHRYISKGQLRGEGAIGRRKTTRFPLCKMLKLTKLAKVLHRCH